MTILGKYSDRILIISFALILCIPAMGLFTEQKTEEIRQLLNREPYAFPSVSLKRLGRTDFKGIENWFADRALLIASLSKITSTAVYKLGTSIKPGQALLGKKDWLFLGNDFSLTIDQYTGKNKPRISETNTNLAALKQMNQTASQYHIPFLVVLAPDKQEIYPEYLPNNIRKGSNKNRLEQLEEGMQHQNLDFVSLKQIELNAKNTLGKRYGDTYFKGDSHWNYLGAYIAYQAIAAHLKQRGLQFNSLNLDFIPGKTTHSDLTNLLQLSHIESNNPTPDFSQVNINLIGKTIEGQITTIDPLAGSPNIINAPYQQINKALKNNQTCLLIGDSFSEALSVYFHLDCHNTIRIHPSNQTWTLKSLIETFHPNIIVYERVQRDLIIPIRAFL